MHSNALGSSAAYKGWEILDLLVDGLFVLDIALHFRLGYYSRPTDGGPQRCVMDGKAIACRYLRFWFWIDSVAIFPWHDRYDVAPTLSEDTASRPGFSGGSEPASATPRPRASSSDAHKSGVAGGGRAPSRRARATGNRQVAAHRQRQRAGR